MRETESRDCRETRVQCTELRVQRQEYRDESTETTGESRVHDQSIMLARVYRDEGTESLQSRECSARGRDESTVQRVQYRETRVQRVEGTVTRVQ